MELWSYRVMELWSYGVMELWSYRVMELWSYGIILKYTLRRIFPYAGLNKPGFIEGKNLYEEIW